MLVDAIVLLECVLSFWLESCVMVGRNCDGWYGGRVMRLSVLLKIVFFMRRGGLGLYSNLLSG